ncbi:MAG TPA: glycosyltransferase family 87 protein [Candidatus Dormibacteraeota bacterium]|nr:glycosyltransferase family 87 protein [Candidatus Dormibacteraeota bacterium]
MNAPAAIRPKALANRRFRALLLVWAGLPIGVLYLWRGLVQPLLLGTYLGDFEESYLIAARRLAVGLDPYPVVVTVLGGAGEYVMPPLLAWLLQPVAWIDSHLLGVVVIIVLNLSLAVFLFCTMRAMKVGVQLAVLLVLVALSFEPVPGNIDEGQVNLVLLALSGVWLWAWIDGRWWGGVALAAAVALKLIQAPVGLLLLVGRRWSMLAAAVITGLGLWLVAAPQYLIEYLFRVVPAISAGTGSFENHSPGGTITRLIQPDTFLGAGGSPPAARVITVVISITALALTLWMLRSPASDPMGRALEAAAVVAVTPIVTSYSWGTHLVLLLLPMLVLIVWSVRRRDWTILGLVAVGDLLIGPGHHFLQTLLVTGYSNLLVLRMAAEFGVAGVMMIWIATLLAVRRQRSPQKLDFVHATAART